MAENNMQDSIMIARKFLDSLLVEGRIIGAVHPTSAVTVLGKTFATPIMTGALSHLKGGMAGFADGAKNAGALCSVGMGDNASLGEVLATGAAVIKIIKPYADREEILSRLRYAEEHGAFGVGMDLEHATGVDDDADSLVAGEQMKLVTAEELKTYIAAAKLPFFVKGALSLQDALRAKEMGAAGVILSHHNGMLKSAVPPYLLLPEIRKAAGPDFLLIADGGIGDGYDAFKALALGATGVCVGRPLMTAIKEDREKGVEEFFRRANGELAKAMACTGCRDLGHLDASVIHRL